MKEEQRELLREQLYEELEEVEDEVAYSNTNWAKVEKSLLTALELVRKLGQ